MSSTLMQGDYLENIVQEKRAKALKESIQQIHIIYVWHSGK